IATGGAGGAPGCSGTMRPCNGACIAASECCGGCGGNTPVCSAGTCVKRSLGDGCSIDAECGTNHCADQHCCDSACDGQCESCKVAGSVGTCVPVTTPRTACGGSGACAGSCDGTAQNRKACVFPGSNTSCGAASCSNSTLTTARTCNGAGTCGAATMMTCSFGCRTDGTVGCATTCASSNQALCGGTCVDVQSSAAHCGSSCQACSGATPKCSSGSCVQCVATSDCSGQGMTCTAQNTCRCGAGYHACGAVSTPCYSDTDVAHCGNGCTDCRQPNANAACGQGDLCANTCKSTVYTLSCPAVAGRPNCSQWTWESATTEGWELAPLDSAHNAATGPLTTSTAEHIAGSSRSLAVNYNNGDASSPKYIEIRVKLCAGGNVLNLTGKHISWSYHLSHPSAGGYNYFIVYPSSDFGGAGGLFDFNADGDGTWHTFNYDLSQPFDQVAAIGFHLELTEGWQGTIYIDDLSIY
ncbi:MAG TPA: hypothetical protein VHM31_17655, partial [Polyangia bacterium]|nr:hypothetical protein [Polyangia bacterium]